MEQIWKPIFLTASFPKAYKDKVQTLQSILNFMLSSVCTYPKENPPKQAGIGDIGEFPESHIYMYVNNLTHRQYTYPGFACADSNITRDKYSVPEVKEKFLHLRGKFKNPKNTKVPSCKNSYTGCCIRVSLPISTLPILAPSVVAELPKGGGVSVPGPGQVEVAEGP